MRLDFLFRLFNHATLALSCACLLQAERQFLPAPELAIAPIAVLVFLAFRSEGRWAMSDGAANLFGVLIAVSGAWWMLLQIYNPSGPVVLPMPVGLVPHLGPIMIALLLVKLFRPRLPADFWVLQGMGLLQISLACVLASDPRFSLFLIIYVVCGLSCLSLHHITRSSESLSSLRTSHFALRTADALHTPFGPFLRRPLLWTLVVGVLAVILFLLTPRGKWASWDPLTRFGIRGGSVRAQTGYAEEINLNRTGELELDDEAAFSVTAADIDGEPKTDLSAVQRWRGTVFDYYHDGRWSLSEFARRNRISIPRTRFLRSLPDFGPDSFVLTYQINPRRAGGVFLAEPIRFGSSDPVFPVGPLEPGVSVPFATFYETLLPLAIQERSEIRYRQVTAPLLEPDRIPLYIADRRYITLLREPPPEQIRSWTLDLLRELAKKKSYDLKAEDLDFLDAQNVGGADLIPRSAEHIARALRAYLAESGEFAYTLDLQRKDMSADPAADFLCNVRAGHCERFASGLVLMLRGCGIPARVVKGFRGAEHQQTEGMYVVRQRDAHSWVEALVPHPPSPSHAAQICGLAGTSVLNLFLTAAVTCSQERVLFDWISLDPTPASGEQVEQEFSLWRWLQHQWRRTDQIWQELILGFNAEYQADLWRSLTGARGVGPALLRLLILAVALIVLIRLAMWIARRFIGWWTAMRTRIVLPQPPAPPLWLTRLFGLLSRHLGVQPNPGQTPRETAATAAVVLRDHAFASPLAELPGRVVELYYRFRYGARPLSDDECRTVEEELSRLESALLTATVQ